MFSVGRGGRCPVGCTSDWRRQGSTRKRALWGVAQSELTPWAQHLETQMTGVPVAGGTGLHNCRPGRRLQQRVLRSIRKSPLILGVRGAKCALRWNGDLITQKPKSEAPSFCEHGWMACTASAPSGVPPELLCLETLEEMQEMQVSAETPPKISELAYAEGFTQRFNACGSPREALAQFSHLPVATVARALYDGSPNPLLLGAVLGHHAPYCQSLAQEYPLLFAPFRGMGVVAALRAFLWCFRLPGESAQIERVLAGFANAFFHHNQPPAGAGDAATGSSGVDRTAVGYYVSQPAGESIHPACAIHKPCTCHACTPRIPRGRDTDLAARRLNPQPSPSLPPSLSPTLTLTFPRPRPSLCRAQGGSVLHPLRRARRATRADAQVLPELPRSPLLPALPKAGEPSRPCRRGQHRLRARLPGVRVDTRTVCAR